MQSYEKNIILVLLTTLTLFSCQKESEVLPQGNGASYWVEKGILNVKNQAVLDSLIAVNTEKSEEAMVAWSDSVGFKSLAAVYKDAEKEKDALSLDELKAKYEGKLVFNSAEPKEKQFTCAVANLDMAGFVNENAQIAVAGEIKVLKDVNSAKFYPGTPILKGGILPESYLQSISGKRCIQVSISRESVYWEIPWIGDYRKTTEINNSKWYVLVSIYCEKKTWTGWMGCNTDLFFTDKQIGVTGGWCIRHSDHRTFHPGKYWAGNYIDGWNREIRISTSGISQDKGISVRIDGNHSLYLTY